jgi:cytochrome c-type biogenesis protein
MLQSALADHGTGEDGQFGSQVGTPSARTAALSLTVFSLVLGIAVLGALLTGPSVGSVNERVELFSSSTGSSLGDLANLLPLGFAFAAGMVSAVNPCGFPMLPAYLGFYLGGGEAAPERGWRAGFGQALTVGGTVTAGFVVLFAVVGLAVGSGAQFLVTSFPWIGLAIGVVLIGAGAWVISGGRLYSALGERLAVEIGGSEQDSSLRGYFLFGLSYGIASLSCTLPIFLGVTGGTVAVDELGTSVSQFVIYAFGMGSVIMALTISMAVFRSARVVRLRRLLPYFERLGSALLLVAGAYVVYYWLTLGGLLNEIS